MMQLMQLSFALPASFRRSPKSDNAAAVAAVEFAAVAGASSGPAYETDD